MNKIDHGIKTIKGQLERTPYTKFSQNGNLMWIGKLWATDNAIYNLMAFGDNAKLYESQNYREGQFLRVKGKHQTSTWNEDEHEEIIFCEIMRWEPAWADKSEILNALQEYCGKLLDYDLGIERDQFSIPAEYDLKHSLVSYEVDICLKCISMLKYNCDNMIEKVKKHDEISEAEYEEISIDDELPFE